MESKSTFVTVITWIFTIASGFTALISLMQSIIFSNMFSDEALRSIPDEASGLLLNCPFKA